MEYSTSSAISIGDEIVAPDFVFIDGDVLIHSLTVSTGNGKTFDSYFDKVICPRVRHDLKQSTRAHIVCDQYRVLTIKEGTREKRGYTSDNAYLVLLKSEEIGSNFWRMLIIRRNYCYSCQKKITE